MTEGQATAPLLTPQGPMDEIEVAVTLQPQAANISAIEIEANATLQMSVQDTIQNSDDIGTASL